MLSSSIAMAPCTVAWIIHVLQMGKSIQKGWLTCLTTQPINGRKNWLKPIFPDVVFFAFNCVSMVSKRKEPLLYEESIGARTALVRSLDKTWSQKASCGERASKGLLRKGAPRHIDPQGLPTVAPLRMRRTPHTTPAWTAEGVSFSFWLIEPPFSVDILKGLSSRNTKGNKS